ncbi:GNAT family N-acetyltransferase [Natronosalvus rutilus]|uniref:GNAT family N-acetyltransferase n=1 Tax=Natronosalvus rutilus TaxID=2953753 RepID=A0A9E7NBY5_9EURY|nr:GNAT family N-acetyltransferase [Natronosalvus rutilus]UTF54125.1 GNAT family N-acetyltransferase [Natronosalvus rutilus]
MTIYRALSEDERDRFHEYVSYAFTPTDGPPAYDPAEHDRPRALLGDRRGLFPDGGGDPFCVCKHYWFDVHVRGDEHSVAGLASVASPPEHRRSGYVRDLLAASLEEYRDRGATLAALWPFRHRFYRQYGWTTANRQLRVECDPADLSFARTRLEAGTIENGRYRRLEADDYETLDPVYGHHAARYDLSINRDADWWRYRVFENWETDPFVAVWERDGEPAGYLEYTIDGDWGDRTMDVAELAYTDVEAFLALLSFCRDHDSQVQTVRFRLPVDTPLLDVASDPDDLETELEGGPMVRIVDVSRALSVLSYPTVDASVTLAVDDPLATWNDGVFELSVESGDGTCERVPVPDSNIALDVGTLSQLAVGVRPARALERAGRLDVSPGTLETLETLFPARSVFLRDGF